MKKRESNIELYRIIVMMLIIAHHYIVNSGYLDAAGPLYQFPDKIRTYFLLIFGAWGKTGINCFVIITAWFMCKSDITLKKFLKLYLEVTFYNIIIPVIFALFGKQTITTTEIIRSFLPFRNIGTGFTQAFIAYYLFIPFINILIHHLSEKQHAFLCVLGFYMYVFLGTNINYSVTFNYVEWFIFIHVFISYIRYYSPEFSEDQSINQSINQSQSLWILMFSLSLLGACASIIICWKMSIASGKYFVYRYVSDVNSLFPFLIGFSSFMLVRNIRIPYCKIVNEIASTCFGVLQIHAASNTMRNWLWYETLANAKQFDTPHVYIHAFLSVIGVFITCSILDYVRIILLERPFFTLFDLVKSRVEKSCEV